MTGVYFSTKKKASHFDHNNRLFPLNCMYHIDLKNKGKKTCFGMIIFYIDTLKMSTCLLLRCNLGYYEYKCCVENCYILEIRWLARDYISKE